MLRTDDNPTEEKRGTADRLSEAPGLLWIILAVMVLAVFAGVMFWWFSH